MKAPIFRGRSRTAATSKMERFVIIVNGFQPLTIITKCSILDAAALDLSLSTDSVTSQFGLQQIIKEPKHIIGDSSSCIDLSFTAPPNLVRESRVHSSLHANCHHHITFSKFNLEIHYSPPYEREVSYYQKANIDQIRQVISEFS